MENITQLNSDERERLNFIKQKADEARLKLVKLAEKHNIRPKQ